MALDIQYTLSGCSGAIHAVEHTNRLTGLAKAVAVGALLFAGFTLWIGQPWMLLLSVPALVMAVGGAQGKNEREPHVPTWVFARERVARRFRVEDGVLTFDGPRGQQECSLRGATIRASDEGVLVTSSVGDAIVLFWEDADPVEVEALAVALQGGAPDFSTRGTASEVPDALQAIGQRAGGGD